MFECGLEVERVPCRALVDLDMVDGLKGEVEVAGFKSSLCWEGVWVWSGEGGRRGSVER